MDPGLFMLDKGSGSQRHLQHAGFGFIYLFFLWPALQSTAYFSLRSQQANLRDATLKVPQATLVNVSSSQHNIETVS